MSITLLRHLHRRAAILPAVPTSRSRHRFPPRFRGRLRTGPARNQRGPHHVESTGRVEPGVRGCGWDRGARGGARRRVRQAGRRGRRVPENGIPEAHPTDQYCAHHRIPENSSRLSRVTVACHMFRLSCNPDHPFTKPPWLTAVAVCCELALPPFALSFSLSLSLSTPPICSSLLLTLIPVFSLSRVSARGCALIPSRPSRTMLEHGPSPPRGISLGGRDPRDGIVSVHLECRHDRKISRARTDTGIDG